MDGATVLCDTDGSGRHYVVKSHVHLGSPIFKKRFCSTKRSLQSIRTSHHRGRPVKDGDLAVWARELTGGDVAVALYNEDDDAAKFPSIPTRLVLTVMAIRVYEIFWAHKDVSDQLSGKYVWSCRCEPHQSGVCISCFVMLIE